MVFMLGYLIGFGLFVLVALLVMYLSHGSGVWKDVKNKKNKALNSCGPIKNLQNVKIANGPVVCVKCPGEVEYRQIKVVTRSARIGSGNGNEIVLNDEFAEPVHAVVKKIAQDSGSYYELVNMSKYNPVQWFNQDINDYETIGYRRGLKLNSKEVFYIGESKIIVTCPTNNHKPSKTERLVMSAGAENRSDENNDKTQVASAKPAPEPTKRIEPTRVYDCMHKAD